MNYDYYGVLTYLLRLAIIVDAIQTDPLNVCDWYI